MNIKNLLVKKLLLKEKLDELNRKKTLYEKTTLDKEIYENQINNFNRQWLNISSNNSFYKMWKEKYKLPNKIEKISDLNNYFPILTKKHINEFEDLLSIDFKDSSTISTGGTSGITTRFPISSKDTLDSYTNGYLGRSWWNINPLDDILMYWGHSHLFGGGIKGKFNHYKKQFSNYLINTKRVSSYSLSYDNVASFYDNLVDFNPSSIISYTSNVYKICKYMEDNNLYYNSDKLKGVILTSESVNDIDIELVNKRLNTEVINEYGMAETGPIAYSYKKTNNIKIFWDSFIITTNKDELVLSSIGQKLFPLINYSSEDKIIVDKSYKGSILTISKIEGKCRNILNIPSLNNRNEEISTILFDHIIKYYPDIFSIQYKQINNIVEIHVTSNKNLDLIKLKNHTELKLKEEFLNLDFSKIIFKQVSEIEKTIAGKIKTIL